MLSNAAYTIPATVYLALFTTAPTNSGGGVEVSGGNYSRVSITNNSTNWPAAVSSAKSNGVAFTFPQATADWGTINGWALLDASSGGNYLFWGTVTTPKTISNGDTASFAVGALSFSED